MIDRIKLEAGLEAQRQEILLRIKHIERDLKMSIDQDEDEGAMDMKQREILYGLYEVEKRNLARIEEELFHLDVFQL